MLAARGGANTVRVSQIEEDRFMVERMPAWSGGPRAIPLGLVAGFLTVALAACGDSPTGPGRSGSAGPCRVACSDASASLHVAIAVSPSSLVCGSAANLGTADEAKKQAVAACGRGDCVPVVWGHGGVAAVAVDQVAYGWGWAAAASATAEARAIALCESRTH
jgi:hypothetical protein